jgi:hypothetical protein
MLIPNKFDGYSRDGRRLYYMGGDEPSTPEKTTQVVELPDWAKGYAKDTLAKGSALTDISKNPYQQYGGERIAGFQPLQQRTFETAEQMQPSQQLGLGSDLASAAGIGALGTNYQAGQFSNQFQDPGQYQPGQFSMTQAQGPSLQNYQMGPAERVRSQNFDSPSAQQYMNPYTQNVVDYQKSQALRDFQIAQPMRNAQAVQQGAFGGSRSAIVDAEAQRSLNSQLQGIEATGQQAAFQNAQQQFNADQARRLQAQQANQQAGLTVGGQNLGANLGVQQLGAGQNLQAQLANQQAFQQAQSAAEQSRQYGAGQGLQAANLAAQYGQSAQQLGEQSRQYGAGLGMQGLQTGLQAAGQLGQLGQNEYGQRMGITQLQSQLGAQQQQQAQRPLDMAYQDFINQQNYPYKQLGFMSDMIRGLPLGQQSAQSVYQGSGNVMGQLAGIGMGAYGLSKMMAEGGEVKTYAGDYGSVTSEGNVQGIIRDLGDLQLQQAKEAALNARDEEQAQMIDQEIARRANLRSTMPPEQFAGIAPALSEEFADGMEQSMATGGIVAFADGDVVSEGKTSRFSQSGLGRFLDAISPPDAQQQEAERLRKYNEFISASQAQPGFFEDVAPEKLKQSQKQVEEAARQLTANRETLKKEADLKDLRANRPPVKGAGARTAPSPIEEEISKETPAAKKKTAKPRFEDITAGPKPSKKEVKSAVAQFAEQNNLGTKQKEDVMTTALKIRDELGKPYQPILDKLNAAIEAQKPNEQAMKDRGLAQALTQFGFGMAERASKPGARFLESASGAAPVIGKVVAETNKLIEAKKDNYAKMQLDQAKYEVALSQGNMQIAATAAAEIRRSQQQDKLLDFNIAKAKDELALKERELAQQAANQAQMLGRYETISSLTREIMQNEGLPYPQALEKAARMLKPTGYAADVRAGTAQNANLDKALKDIDAKQKYAFLTMMRPDNPKYAGLKAEYEAEKRAAYARYGGGETAAPSAAISPDAFLIEKISN